MKNVFRQAQKKRLDYRIEHAEGSIDEQSKRDSEQLIAHLDDVVSHYTAAEDSGTGKRKLQELHQHYHQCYRNRQVTAPNEL